MTHRQRKRRRIAARRIVDLRWIQHRLPHEVGSFHIEAACDERRGTLTICMTPPMTSDDGGTELQQIRTGMSTAFLRRRHHKQKALAALNVMLPRFCGVA